MKAILFAFMEEGACHEENKEAVQGGYPVLWLLDGEEEPSHTTICNFINKQLKDKIEDLF